MMYDVLKADANRSLRAGFDWCHAGRQS